MQSWTPQLVLQPLRQSPPDKFAALYWCASLVVPTTVLGGIMLGSSGVFGPGVDKAGAITTLTVLLYAFCLAFAVNSAIHSYLIVRYSEGDKVRDPGWREDRVACAWSRGGSLHACALEPGAGGGRPRAGACLATRGSRAMPPRPPAAFLPGWAQIAMQVGAYYASNAVGRLVGTLASGALYTWAGGTVVERFGVCLLASTAFSAMSTLVDAYLTEDQAGSSWLGFFNRCLPAGMLQPVEAPAAAAVAAAE
jgi:hypothetical protein